MTVDARRKPGRPPRQVEEGRRRRSMSGGTQKLSLPQHIVEAMHDKGYRLYWMRDDPGRLEVAKEGGYEFVKADEVAVNDFIAPGNGDLGTNVRRASGDTREGGQAVRVYLMKQKLEWHDEDQRGLATMNNRIDNIIRKGISDKAGEGLDSFQEVGQDRGTRYVKSGSYLRTGTLSKGRQV